MIFAKDLHNFFKQKKIDFFTGVPDSVLKNFTKLIEIKKKHVIAANEGNAIAIASGYYLTKKKIPCVYMQNSGLGNAINPLASLTHSNVYSIPMLLLIGWRGSPNQNDEPQHKTKGIITQEILKLLKIKNCVINSKKDLKKLNKLLKHSISKKEPVACLIKNKTILSDKNYNLTSFNNGLKRHEIIKKFLKIIPNKTNIVATTGYTSRELYQIRKSNNLFTGKDFYMVGAMGHASNLALGFSLFSKKTVICLDGDGSILMHLGSLGTNAFFGGKNFKHILFNNNSHESVGGQKTVSGNINFKNLTRSLGYKKYLFCNKNNNITKTIIKFLKLKGPVFLEFKIQNQSLKNLSRPKKLKKIKNNFISK